MLLTLRECGIFEKDIKKSFILHKYAVGRSIMKNLVYLFRKLAVSIPRFKRANFNAQVRKKFFPSEEVKIFS